MKKILFPVILMFIALGLKAQAPEKIGYQAIIRDHMNQLVVNQLVGIRISILEESTPVYTETHLVATNENGLVNIKIGEGETSFGSFDEIEWWEGSYFLQTEVDTDGGTDYGLTGTTQLLSVPYALHAKSAQWRTAENNIYYDKGFVGIGTQSPSVPLEVAGDFRVIKNGGMAVMEGYGTGNEYYYSGVRLGNSATGAFWGIFHKKDRNLQIIYWNGFGWVDPVWIDPNGNVGIGGTASNAKFTVRNGEIYIHEPGEGIIMKSPNGGCYKLSVSNEGMLQALPVTCP